MEVVQTVWFYLLIDFKATKHKTDSQKDRLSLGLYGVSFWRLLAEVSASQRQTYTRVGS
jgi:hypothetical protein